MPSQRYPFSISRIFFGPATFGNHAATSRASHTTARNAYVTAIWCSVLDNSSTPSGSAATIATLPALVELFRAYNTINQAVSIPFAMVEPGIFIPANTVVALYTVNSSANNLVFEGYIEIREYQ